MSILASVDLSLLSTLFPYTTLFRSDKITREMQERYYISSPHNLVRIILGKRDANDSADENVYTRAAKFFADWRHDRSEERRVGKGRVRGWSAGGRQYMGRSTVLVTL